MANLGYILDGTNGIMAGSLNPHWICNVGISLAANVFSITGANASWSALNPGFITVPSTTAGQFVTLQFTAAVTFNDDSHVSPSFPVNMGCGVTTTVDWAQDVPFFLYVVNEDNTSANAGFFFTRNPCLTVTPAAGYIHDLDAVGATADSQLHICGIWNDDAGKAAKPCRLIGAFRMRWDTTSDGWTVQTLGNTDGIGDWSLAKTFATSWTFPGGQNGCATAANVFDVAGASTTLVFTNQTQTYRISPNGMVDYAIRSTARTAADATNDVIQFYIPYAGTLIPTGYSVTKLGGTVTACQAGVASSTTTMVRFSEGATGTLEVDSFSGAGDYINANIFIQAF